MPNSIVAVPIFRHGGELTMNNGEIVIYQNPNGTIKIDVRLEEETVWLSQSQMAELFGKSKKTISEHIQNIFSEGELSENSVVRKFRITDSDGENKPWKSIGKIWRRIRKI